MKFGVGDIVKEKGCSDDIYYIIIDTYDFTEEDSNNIDIDYEVMQIFPVDNDDYVTTFHQDSIEMVAKFETRENDSIVNFILRERQVKLNDYSEPMFFNAVLENLPPDRKSYSDDYVYKKKPIPHKEHKKFNEIEIRRILEDKSSEKEIKVYIEKMDKHLELLHKAIENNDAESINLQQEQLEKIRKRLMELEYFKLKR